MPSAHRSPTGYATWRGIADELRREILDGTLAPGARLPSEERLAERFEVHRGTVRQAVAALAAEDLVHARRGSGTFVADHRAVVHRVGARTRLGESLAGSEHVLTARLIEAVEEAEPPEEVAARLALAGRPALRMEAVRLVDDVPVSRATHWFDAALVNGLPEAFQRTGSITAALAEAGIADYVRLTTSIGASPMSASDARDLDVRPGSVVLLVRALDGLADGTPLQFGVTRFRGDRVELDVEHEPQR